MLDTLALRSQSVSEGLSEAVERFLITRMGFDNRCGEVAYTIVSGSLPGSYSDSVSVNICRKDAVAVQDERGKTTVVLKDCPPFLRIEGSVHKAMLGHNVYGGPVDLAASGRWFIEDLAKRFGQDLPRWDTWLTERIDWAEVFDLGTFEGCEEYVRGMAWAQYPRRKVHRYAEECVLFPGTTTATKVYHKGPEFAKHGNREATIAFGGEAAEELQLRANRYLRPEVSIRSKKLQADFGHKPTLMEVTREYLERIWSIELSRILREGKTDMQTVRKSEEVRGRLCSMYGARLSPILYATWVGLATRGEKRVRSEMSRPTFYRQRKQLVEAGISWSGSDIYVTGQSVIPDGFSLCLSDRHRMKEVHPKVSALCLSLAA